MCGTKPCAKLLNACFFVCLIYLLFFDEIMKSNRKFSGKCSLVNTHSTWHDEFLRFNFWWLWVSFWWETVPNCFRLYGFFDRKILKSRNFTSVLSTISLKSTILQTRPPPFLYFKPKSFSCTTSVFGFFSVPNSCQSLPLFSSDFPNFPFPSGVFQKNLLPHCILRTSTSKSEDVFPNLSTQNCQRTFRQPRNAYMFFFLTKQRQKSKNLAEKC